MSHLLCAGVALSASHTATASCNFSGVDTALNNLISVDKLNGGAVLIGTAKGILHETYVGTYTATDGKTATYSKSAILPVASSSKLLSGVRILQLVDRGVLHMDAPVSDYLNGSMFQWNTANHTDQITLRQMFSHTAGYGNDENDPLLENPTITLEQSVSLIASNYQSESPQDYLPTPTLFAYGGVSMQIGGEVAQQASGIDWESGWKTDIGAPMCVSSIDWQAFVPAQYYPTQNYHISGGAQSTLEDYARVLAMLLNGGVGNGTRLLSSNAISTLTHSQTGNAIAGCATGCVPTAEVFATSGGGTYTNTQYSVGTWIEPVGADGGVSVDSAPTISSIGKFGFAPWVDYSSGTFGILMIYDPTQDSETGKDAASVTSHAAMEQIITDAIVGVRAQVPADGMCPAMTVYDNIFADGMDVSPPPPQCPGTVQIP